MMILAAIAINRPMPLPGATEKNICTAICMYIPEPEYFKEHPEEPKNAHYEHVHFQSWEKLSEWVAATKLGSRLTTVH
jgi:hypothetical protein